MPSVPLGILVDEAQWEAEGIAARLGIVAHTAFLLAGFVPYEEDLISGHLLKHVDEMGPSAPCLSRRYTARREGSADAMLELHTRGSGDVVFQVYLLTTDGDRGCLSYEEVLDEAILAPLLSCSLADATSAWLWKDLADWVIPALPVTSFASLPDEAKVEILKRLTDGKDLARMECVSSQLRRLMADRDDELWKAMYESLHLPVRVRSSDSEGLGSWKERYMEASRLRAWLFDSYDDDEDWLAQRRRQQEPYYLQRLREFILSLLRGREDLTIVMPTESMGFAYPADMVHDDPPELPPEQEVATRIKKTGRQPRKMQRSNYQKKPYGTGAIHSPSSRYKWKHR